MATRYYFNNHAQAVGLCNWLCSMYIPFNVVHVKLGQGITRVVIIKGAHNASSARQWLRSQPVSISQPATHNNHNHVLVS